MIVRFMTCASLFLTCLSLGESAKILGVFSTPAKSHLIIHMSVMRALVEQGHDVTVFTTLPLEDKVKKYRHIQVGLPNMLSKEKMVEMAKEKVEKPKNFLFEYQDILPKMLFVSNYTINSMEFKSLLNESFDLVVLGYFLNDFQLGIAAHFKCPVVVNFMIQPFTQLLDMSGTPKEISYVPNLFTGLQQPMGFTDRLYNFVYSGILEPVVYKWGEWQQEKMYRYNFPESKYPSLSEVKKNVSLVLINHHFSQGGLRPLPPGMVEIGGIQIKEKPNPLPEDIKEFLDESKNGVVYFSFGSHVASGSLRPEITKAMFNVLSKIPFNVLWKWDDSAPVPGTSDNIMYKPWTPQDDVLAHPNVKLFISHGGQGGVVEAEYHGVPLLICSFFGDQHANKDLVIKKEFGRGFPFKTLTEEIFRKEVLEILENPKYSENIKKFSSVYRDRPMTAKQTAVFWIEYVIRHKGAFHMQSPLVHLNFFQQHSLDVLGFLAVSLIVLLKVCCVFICFIKRKLSSGNKLKVL
ncbi:UGT2A1.2 family protein [Megaselia abdita]